MTSSEDTYGLSSHSIRTTRPSGLSACSSYSPPPAYPVTSSPSVYTLPTSPHKEQTIDGCEAHPQRRSACVHSKGCQKSRLKRFLIPLVLAVVCLGAVGLVSCAGGYTGVFNEWNGPKSTGDDDDSVAASSRLELTRLARRVLEGAAAAADSGAGGGDGGVFVDQKLYLIVIFVGLVLVVLAGIMLSAWCCKGAFQNPCCCPCYLCAYCGGLACLECIGCGLCAEGFEQIAQDG